MPRILVIEDDRDIAELVRYSAVGRGSQFHFSVPRAGGNPGGSRTRILFLCVHNAARSQMAEGLARALADRAGADVEVWSAGADPRGVHPLAARVMREMAVDISRQRSKGLSEVPAEFDFVVTLCDEAAEACPRFPGKARLLHWSLPDPAAAAGDEAEQLRVFRQIRDALRARLEDFCRGELGFPPARPAP